MTIFYLPDLGEGLMKAEIIKWHVKIGDNIQQDQVMVTVETAKSLVDIPSPVSAVVTDILAAVNTTVTTGSKLIIFAGDKILNQPKNNIKSIINQDKVNLSSTVNNNYKNNIIKAQPAARALAKSLNIDINLVSSNKSIISIEDVIQYNQEDNILPKRRAQMCALASQANTQTVPATLTESINIVNWYQQVSFLPFVIKAVANALLENPAVNCHYIPHKTYQQFSDKTEIGIAIQTDKALFVPKIVNAETKDLATIKTELNLLKQQAKLEQLTLEQTLHPTFVISNIGSLGFGKFATPMLFPPAVAIIALGAVYKQPAIIDNKLTAVDYLPISITFDHRVVYGAEVANFIKSLNQALSVKTA